MGGEYATLDAYLTKLVTDLWSCGIHLVIYVDGARGSSETTMERKLQTWKDRQSQSLQQIRDNLDVLVGCKQIADLSDRSSIRPVLLEVQMFETFKACDCEVVYCAAGEADYVLVRNLMIRPDAFAILSNDSDFCIFRDCRFIPCQLFDTNNDLMLGGTQRMPEKPERLTVGVIHTHQVATLLQVGSSNLRASTYKYWNIELMSQTQWIFFFFLKKSLQITQWHETTLKKLQLVKLILTTSLYDCWYFHNHCNYLPKSYQNYCLLYSVQKSQV